MARGPMSSRSAAPEPGGNASPPPGAPGPGVVPPPGPGAPQGAGADRRATDEEKDTFRQLLGNAMNALYQEQSVDALAETLRFAQEAGSPGQATEPIAQAIAGAVAVVAFSGVQQGMQIEQEMVGLAAASLAHDVGRTIAEAAGVPPLGDEQLQTIYLRASEILADRAEAGGQNAGPGEGQTGNGPGMAGTPTGPSPGGAAGNGLMAAPPAGNRQQRRAAAAQARQQQRRTA